MHRPGDVDPPVASPAVDGRARSPPLAVGGVGRRRRRDDGPTERGGRPRLPGGNRRAAAVGGPLARRDLRRSRSRARRSGGRPRRSPEPSHPWPWLALGSAGTTTPCATPDEQSRWHVRSGDLFAQVDTLTQLEIIEWLAGEYDNRYRGPLGGPPRGRPAGPAEGPVGPGAGEPCRGPDRRRPVGRGTAGPRPGRGRGPARSGCSGRPAVSPTTSRSGAAAPCSREATTSTPAPAHRTLDDNTKLDDLLAATTPTQTSQPAPAT